MSLGSNILSSALVGCGVGLALLASVHDLPSTAYAISIPFWPLIVMPSGVLWKNKFLNRINEGQFPSEMKNYRQLFLFHRKAIVYELVLNQIGYHSLLGLSFFAYTYWARTLYDKNTPRKQFSAALIDSLPGFVKLRALFVTISLLTQFWGSKLNLQKNAEGGAFINPNVIRLLIMKQTLINVLWMTSVAKLAHQQYSSIPITSVSDQMH